MPGYRHRYLYYATGLPGWMRPGWMRPGWMCIYPTMPAMWQYPTMPAMWQLSKEQEILMLENQAKMLEQQLEQIKNRIAELGK